MSVFGSQNYKEVVQLALRAKKLTRERRSRGNFQKKRFEFISGQSSKKSRSSDSSENSSGSKIDFVSSP